MQVAGVTPPIRPTHVSFRLGPRLNAAGRVGVAQDALELLLTDDTDRATFLARSLDWLRIVIGNRSNKRPSMKSLQQLAHTFVADRDAAIVVGSRGWHPGVVGIVASRLTKQFHRPSVVIGFDDSGEGKGSGRSVPGLSIVKALEECGEYLVAIWQSTRCSCWRPESRLDQPESFSTAFQACRQASSSRHRILLKTPSRTRCGTHRP